MVWNSSLDDREDITSNAIDQTTVILEYIVK